jgi:hypothetical protein
MTRTKLRVVGAAAAAAAAVDIVREVSEEDQ